MSDPDVKPASTYPALAEALPRIPRGSGVYLFKEAGGRVLYVGKAVNLKHRLASYLKTPEKHDPKTALMLKKMAQVDVILTATGREALILERNLIKEHRPRYNVMLRDDKNYLCLRLDLKETFPALRFVRRFHPDGALYFGPYASGGMARETLKVMKQAFGVRTCKERRLAPRSRPCLEYQLAHCLGPCAGLVTEAAYRQAVAEAVLFLKGKGGNLLKRLKEQMAQAAADLDFERAAILRDRIRAITATLERQDMARPTFRDQDVLGLAEEEGQALIAVLLVRAGLVTGSREYFFPELPPDGDLLGAFLKQYYTEGRPLPDEMLLPEDVPDRRLLEALFSDEKGAKVALLVAPGGERARLLALAADNARAALNAAGRPRSPGRPLQDLQARLNLPNLPARLECLDISTLQGEQPVGALAAFTDGVPDKSRYRRFKIKEVAGQDDYAMLREVVRRHYGKAGQELPDLLVVDGGRGQLNVVLQTLKEMALTKIPVVGLAKADGAGRPPHPRPPLSAGPQESPPAPGQRPGLAPAPPAPGRNPPLRHHLPPQTGRDKSCWPQPYKKPRGSGRCGVGSSLTHFPNLDAVKSATPAEIAALPGFNQKVAENLKDWLAGEGEGT